jgi:predicted nuclease of predicted toxin-antitoxin system
MRAKLDGNVPVEAAGLLRAAGWDCETIYDEGLAGADDPKVAAVCQAEVRVLFTLDLDFADIRTYPPGDYAGIVVLRPNEPTRRGAWLADPPLASVVGGVGRASAVDRGGDPCSRAKGERTSCLAAHRPHRPQTVAV